MLASTSSSHLHQPPHPAFPLNPLHTHSMTEMLINDRHCPLRERLASAISHVSHLNCLKSSIQKISVSFSADIHGNIHKHSRKLNPREKHWVQFEVRDTHPHPQSHTHTPLYTHEHAYLRLRGAAPAECTYCYIIVPGELCNLQNGPAEL